MPNKHQRFRRKKRDHYGFDPPKFNVSDFEMVHTSKSCIHALGKRSYDEMFSDRIVNIEHCSRLLQEHLNRHEHSYTENAWSNEKYDKLYHGHIGRGERGTRNDPDIRETRDNYEMRDICDYHDTREMREMRVRQEMRNVSEERESRNLDTWSISSPSTNYSNSSLNDTNYSMRSTNGDGNAYVPSTDVELPIQNDIQSINWSSFTHRTRSEYQLERLRIFFHMMIHEPAFEQMFGVGASPSNANSNPVQDVGFHFQFRKSSRYAKCNFTHFQLRHLVKALRKDLVYYLENQNVMEFRTSVIRSELCHAIYNKDLQEGNDSSIPFGGVYNPTFASGIKRPVIEFQGDSKGLSIGACQGFDPNDEGFVALGGYDSEFVVKNLSTNKIIFDKKVSETANAFVNCIQMRKIGNYNNIACAVSCNNGSAHLYNVYKNGVELNCQIPFEACVNNAVYSPNGELLLVSGDFNDVIVVDPKSQKQVMKLIGHTHYGFALSWHPSKFECATGSQDKTSRIYDLRSPGMTLATLESNGRPVQSLEYSNDGKILCAGECADFVHLYDSRHYNTEQQLDLLGEITGCSFSPDSNALFIGVQDVSYSSLVEFDRWNNRTPLNNLLL